MLKIISNKWRSDKIVTRGNLNFNSIQCEDLKMKSVITMEIIEWMFFLLNRIKQKISEYIFCVCVSVLQFRGDSLHVAFIADGNRTYSKRHNISRHEAYMKGMEKILHQIKLSSMLKITDLTFFIYSNHNNQRKFEEKNDIFVVIEKLLKSLLSYNADYCYNIIGDTSSLPSNIHTLCNQLLSHSNSNAHTTINLAINYSAKFEMTQASERLLNKYFTESHITESTLDCFMYTRYSPKPDIVIRTSKQRRLSDFLTWQAIHSSIFFLDQCWPEFSDWTLTKYILYYQFFTKRKAKREVGHLCYSICDDITELERENMKKLKANFNKTRVF